MTDHIITVHTMDEIWLIGSVDEYPFWTKVYDEPSGFGIDGGRVIKLHIGSKRKSGEIASYERGWDKYPRGAHKGLVQAVIRFCESLSDQNTWQSRFKPERRFFVTEDGVLECEEESEQ